MESRRSRPGASMAQSSTPSWPQRYIFGVAVLKTCQESQEIQSYTTDPNFLQDIIKFTADALHSQYHQPQTEEKDDVRP